MKKRLLTGLAIGLLLGSASFANALSYTFNYGGYDWGTMTIEQFGVNSLAVTYTASSTAPTGTLATGFGFAPNLGIFTISNPLNSTFTGDQDALNWIPLANINPIPNPANSSLTKDDFSFGATEGNANNFTPPGIGVGEWDIFYLNYNHAVFPVDITTIGVRLQSFSVTIDNSNVQSLFLVPDPSNPVPEPATMLLFGTGLAGLAGIARRKVK